MSVSEQEIAVCKILQIPFLTNLGEFSYIQLMNYTLKHQINQKLWIDENNLWS